MWEIWPPGDERWAAREEDDLAREACGVREMNGPLQNAFAAVGDVLELWTINSNDDETLDRAHKTCGEWADSAHSDGTAPCSLRSRQVLRTTENRKRDEGPDDEVG